MLTGHARQVREQTPGIETRLAVVAASETSLAADADARKHRAVSRRVDVLRQPERRRQEAEAVVLVQELIASKAEPCGPDHRRRQRVGVVEYSVLTPVIQI